MNKKKYLRPETEIINLNATDIIATSTGASGDDVPWAARQDGDFFDFDE